MHAHYASSYGLIGSLMNFSPFVLSVWGSDVFEFPKLGIINKLVLKYNFFKADKILSTSNIMAKEIQLYTNKDIEVIKIELVGTKPDKQGIFPSDHLGLSIEINI